MLTARLRTIATLFVLILPASLAPGDVVVLSTGERLYGTVVEQADDAVTFDHPVLGRIVLEVGAVNQVILTDDAEPAETPQQAEEAEPEAEEEAPAEEAVPTEKAEEEDVWKSNIDLGFSVSEGNTENKNLTLSFKTVRDTEMEKTTFDASYYFAEDDGEASENKATVGLNQDWKVPDSRWLYFARARYDYDEFNSWKSRVTAGGGLGYQFYTLEDFKLIGRAGLVGVKEYDSDRDDIRLEGLLGVELDWKIDEQQNFALESTYFPDFEETGEFRWITSAKWELDIVAYDGMSLFLGLLHEHQSLVDPGQENDDLFVFGGLSIEF